MTSYENGEGTKGWLVQVRLGKVRLAFTVFWVFWLFFKPKDGDPKDIAKGLQLQLTSFGSTSFGYKDPNEVDPKDVDPKDVDPIDVDMVS